MGMRNIVRKGTKRIGGAFGASDVLNRLNGINETLTRSDLSSIKPFLDTFDRDFWAYVFPFTKFYYYNELAKNIHPLVFEKYRGCNKGKKLVIVACGPSVDKYRPIHNAKHLAINRAFLRDDIPFDYIFMHDKLMISEHGEELKRYNADKFMAFATNHQNAELFNATSEDIVGIGAKRFLISDVGVPNTAGGQFDIIQTDISHGILFDRGGGTVFSALQFALFTQPKEIYLVGCDCTRDGYFKNIKKNTKQNLLEKTEYLWHEAKAFVDQYYADTKIISVNPVSLRGLFTDLDQN